MIYIDLDFETKSLCDLLKCGSARYSEDISTEVLCLSYTTDGWSTPLRWWPGQDRASLLSLVCNPEVMFVAHGAGFEQDIWKNQMVALYGWPEIPIERWDCTMAAVAYKGGPLALDKGPRFFGIPVAKDMEGNTLVKELSGLGKAKRMFKKTGMLPVVTPDILDRVMTYCDQDVVVEHAIEKKVNLISRISPNERTIWLNTERMNQRGIALDLDLVNAMIAIKDKATLPLLDEFQKGTGLPSVKSLKLKDWCMSQGVPIENLQKGYLAKLLGSEEDDTDPAFGYESLADDDLFARQQDIDIPANVRRMLEIRQMLGGAAILKLPRMLQCVGYDGRARRLIQYYAAHSGRFGGRLFQPHNFPRDSVKGLSPDETVAAILSRDPRVVEEATGLPPLDALARSLRHVLVPGPGKKFLVGDFKAIEAVIVLAMAGHQDLAREITDGAPIYMETAEQIFKQPKGTWACADEKQYKKNKELFVEQYTAGKATILGCGFQMGWQKHQAQCRIKYGIELTDAQAQDAVNTYRNVKAPLVPEVWYDTQDAAYNAACGKRDEAYGVLWEPIANGEWVRATLQNHWQKLYYPYPQLSIGKFGGPSWTYRSGRGGGNSRVQMYGGLETENVVQALARGILCAAIDRLERAGFPVVLTVHDEIVCEVPIDSTDLTLVNFKRLMETTTLWSDEMGIPIRIEEWEGDRYRK